MSMKRIPLFIFIVAEDDYDRDSLIDQIKDAADGGRAVVESYYRHDSDIYAVLDSALNLPLFTEQKIVILKYQDSFIDSDAAALIDYLARASRRSTFVLATRSLKIKKEKRDEKTGRMTELLAMLERASGSNFLKQESRGVLVEIKSRKKGGEDLIASWVREIMKKKELKIGREAASFLVEMCGMDRNIIVSEVEKLSGFKEKGETVTIDDVRMIAAENRVFDIYALIESICAGNHARSSMILRNLMETDVRHSLILWQLDSFFSRAAAAKYFIRKGTSEEEAAMKAGQRYYIREFLREVDSLEEARLHAAPSRLLEADRLIKSGLPEKTVLEKLVFDLT